MRREGFTRGLVFAALAAGGWLPFVLVAGPILGGRTALSLYLVVLSAAYVAAIGSRVAVTAAAALAGAVLLAIARGPVGLAVGLGAVVAGLRSGVLWPRPLARAVVLEVALVGGGLAFARALAGATPFAVTLAIWGFFLVQSGFFLVSRTTERTSGRGDPFEEARRRALALLDGAG